MSAIVSVRVFYRCVYLTKDMYVVGQLVHCQGRSHGTFFGEAKPMGGHNLPPPLVEIGLTYLNI